MNRAVSANAPGAPSTGQAAPKDAQVIDFPAGIPGFETCRRFVLVISDELKPLAYLRALDPPEASFLTVDPVLIEPAYDLTLREFERARLGATVDDKLVWLSLVTILNGTATANLRAPVVINPRRMIGCQFIRDDRDYAVDFPLGKA
jgi:flagellar assembly factor FliW